MKRYGNLWDKIVTKENLILAFEKHVDISVGKRKLK